MKRVKNYLAIALFLLVNSASTALALSTDKNQPIQIEADQLNIDESAHISIYKGNVTMQQGSLHILADTIVFHFSAENELNRLEIEGSPATLDQINDNNEPVSGSAKKIIYSENQLLIQLMGNARFSSSEDSIEGEWITINTDTDALTAGSKEGKNRVRMLIQPKNTTQE